MLDRLRRTAASRLQPYHVHVAGGGSLYITIGDLGEPTVRVRYADHENVSVKHREPDYNCVNRRLTEDELAEIERMVPNARLAKKTAVAKHLGITVPKLRKLLPSEAYEDVCENEAYPNTYTQYVIVAKAHAAADAAGITARIAVAQESVSEDDYAGDRS